MQDHPSVYQRKGKERKVEFPIVGVSTTISAQNASLLLYTALKVCSLTMVELHSLNFAVTRFLVKLFKTSSIAVIKTALYASAFNCQDNFLEKGS